MRRVSRFAVGGAAPGVGRDGLESGGEILYSRANAREAYGAGGWSVAQALPAPAVPAAAGASPVIADGHLYLVAANGKLTVVRTGDKLEVVHEADLGAPVTATPALEGNALYVRTDSAVLAFR